MFSSFGSNQTPKGSLIRIWTHHTKGLGYIFYANRPIVCIRDHLFKRWTCYIHNDDNGYPHDNN